MASEAPPTVAEEQLAPPARKPVRELPLWPLVILFGGFGIWWALGVGSFAVALVSAPMLILLLMRGNIAMPPGFLLWLLFVAWACVAAIELKSGLQLLGFAMRTTSYVGATVVFLYVFNLSRSRVPDRAIVGVLVLFAVTVVVGGWLGVLFPTASLSTPTQMLMPKNLTDNDLVRLIVNPSMAQIETPFGSPVSFSRPRAPFTYTNAWGCNLALLAPFIAAAFTGASRRLKLGLLLLMAAAVVPALATLNRGMYLAIGLGVVYAAIHYARKGKLAPLAGVVVAGAAMAALAFATGLAESVATRLQYTDTNVSRETTYQEAFHGTLASPLFGYGAPRPSNTLDISVGTQGQLWNIMFSYGFVALAAYLAWFVYAVVRSRSWQTPTQLWMHVVLVTVLLTTFYYGYDGPQLAVAMVAAGVALRPAEPS